MHHLIAAIREHARQHPGKAALRWRCSDYPYAALEAMIDTRARALQLKGIRAGDVVAFHAAPCLDAVVDTAALWALGASAAPITTAASGTLAGNAIRSGAAGFMHPGGYYVRTVRPTSRPASSGKQTQIAALVLPSDPTRAAGLATWLYEVKLQHLVLRAEKRFTLSARTVLGLSTSEQHHSLLDVWAPLAAGGTVDLLTDRGSMDGASLIQFFRETEADLVVADPAFYRRAAAAGAAFPQFRDVIVTGHPGSRTRTAMADAFPGAIFRQMDILTGDGTMIDYCPAEFARELPAEL